MTSPGQEPPVGILLPLGSSWSACSLTLSYSSLALLSISRMSMGLWSLQPLAWLGLCLSRAACWDRRVSSSTTLEEENKVIYDLTQEFFWCSLSKDTGKMSHGNTVLTIQNKALVTSYKDYMTNPLTYSQLCQPIYFTVRRTKIQNFILEWYSQNSTKLSFLKCLKIKLTDTVNLKMNNSTTSKEACRAEQLTLESFS